MTATATLRVDRVTQVPATSPDEESHRFRRRVKLFKRAGLVALDAAPIPVCRAVQTETLHAAYRMVHDVFVEQSYIVPQPGGLRVRVFEALPEMATFVALQDDQVIGVMSLVPDTPDLGLPSDKAFRPELNSLRRQNRWVGEVTNLAVAPGSRNTTVFLELSRCIYAHAANIGLDDLFISISPGHSAFFEDILRFEPYGEARDYGDSVVDMVEGKRLDVAGFGEALKAADRMLDRDAFLYDWFFTDNHHYETCKASEIDATKRFYEPALLRELFGSTTKLLERCTNHHREAIRHRWGDELLAQIEAHSRPEAELREVAA